MTCYQWYNLCLNFLCLRSLVFTYPHVIVIQLTNHVWHHLHVWSCSLAASLTLIRIVVHGLLLLGILGCGSFIFGVVVNGLFFITLIFTLTWVSGDYWRIDVDRVFIVMVLDLVSVVPRLNVLSRFTGSHNRGLNWIRNWTRNFLTVVIWFSLSFSLTTSSA